MAGVMDRLRGVAERHALRPRRAFEETMLVLDEFVDASEKATTSENEGLVWEEVAREAAKSLFHQGNIDGVYASAAASLGTSSSMAVVERGDEASGAGVDDGGTGGARVRQGKRKRKYGGSGDGGAGNTQRESYHRLIFAWTDRVLLNVNVGCGVNCRQSDTDRADQDVEAMVPLLVLEMMHALCGARRRSRRTEKDVLHRLGKRHGRRHSRRRGGKSATMQLSDADAERVLVFARRLMEPAFRRLQDEKKENEMRARLLMVLADTWRLLLAPENGERVGLSAGQIHAIWEGDETLRRDMYAHASEARVSRLSLHRDPEIAAAICKLVKALTDIDSSSMHDKTLLVDVMAAALVYIESSSRGGRLPSTGELNAHDGEALLLRLFRISSTRPLQLKTLIHEFTRFFALDCAQTFSLEVPFEDSIKYLTPKFLEDVFAVIARQPQSRSAELVDTVCTTLFDLDGESEIRDKLSDSNSGKMGVAAAGLIICGDFLGTILDALPLDSTNKAQVLECVGKILESNEAKRTLLLGKSTMWKDKHVGMKYMRMRVYHCLIAIGKECRKSPPRQLGEVRAAPGGVLDDAIVSPSISGLPWYDRPVQLIVSGVGGATTPEDTADDIRARTDDIQALLSGSEYGKLPLSNDRHLGEENDDERVDIALHIFYLEFAINAISVLVQVRNYIASIQYSRASILNSPQSLQTGNVIDSELEKLKQTAEQFASRITTSICNFVQLKIRNDDVLGFRAAHAWTSMLTHFETISEFADQKSLAKVCTLITQSLTVSGTMPSPLSSMRAVAVSLRTNPYFYSSKRIRSVFPRAMCLEMRRSCRDLFELMLNGEGFDVIKADLPLDEDSRGSGGSATLVSSAATSDIEPTPLIAELRILTNDMSETYYRGEALFPKSLIESNVADSARAHIESTMQEYVGILNLIRGVPNGYLVGPDARKMARMLLSELHLSACLLQWIRPAWAFAGLVRVVSSLLKTSAAVIGCYNDNVTPKGRMRRMDADAPYLLKWLGIVVKLVVAVSEHTKARVERRENAGAETGLADSGIVVVDGEDISDIQDSVADFVRGVIASVAASGTAKVHENAHIVGIVDDSRCALDDSAKARIDGHCTSLQAITTTRAHITIARGFLEWALDETHAIDVDKGGRISAWIERCCEELGGSIQTLLQVILPSASMSLSRDDGNITACTDEMYRCLSLVARVCRLSAEPSTTAAVPSRRASQLASLGLLITGPNIASSCRRIVTLVKTVPPSSSSALKIPAIHVSIAGSLMFVAESMLALSLPRFAVGDPVNEQPEVCQRLTTMLVFLHQRLDAMTPSLKVIVTETTRQYVSLLSLALIYRFYRQLKELLASSTSLDEGTAVGVLRILSLAIDVHARRKDVSNLIALATEGISTDLVALAYRSVAPDCNGDVNVSVIAELLNTFSRVCQRVNHFAMTSNDIADAMQATITILSRCLGGRAQRASRLNTLFIAECCCEIQKSLVLFRPQTMRCLAFLTAFSRACLRVIVSVDDDDSMEDDDNIGNGNSRDARYVPPTSAISNERSVLTPAAAEIRVARSLASLYAALAAHSTTVTLYATHLLADVISTTATANTMPDMHLSSATASTLSPGVYALLDLLTAREMQLLYATLGVGTLGKLRQDALRNLKREYEREHKYTGKI